MKEISDDEQLVLDLHEEIESLEEKLIEKDEYIGQLEEVLSDIHKLSKP